MDSESHEERASGAVGVARQGARDSRAHPRRAAGVVLAAVVVAVAFVLRYPNVRTAPGYLALVVVTPLLFGVVLALSRPVLGRQVPSAISIALRSALALILMLDFGFFVIVGFIRTEAHDTAPVFVTPTVVARSHGTATPGVTPTSARELMGQFDHRQGIDTAAGTAILGMTAGNLYVLRLQDFAASHGPDLYVYLSRVAAPTTSADVMNGLEVAPLKATSGNQNYSLPASFDPGAYKAVVIYCKSFSTIFGYATLA
jgi:electron transfer DM13